MGQFGVGQAVRRVEDGRLLTGQGNYGDDVNRPGQAYGYVLRSPFAHARLGAVDVYETPRPGARDDRAMEPSPFDLEI